MCAVAHFAKPSLLNVLADAHTRLVDLKLLREALRVRRRALDWSLDKLAAESGINRHTIHAIENVRRKPKLQPELETLEKLADAMEMGLLVELLHKSELEKKW